MWALTFILASAHWKPDELWTIRHNEPSDTLWTEEPSNSFCTPAKHSGTFCVCVRARACGGGWNSTFGGRRVRAKNVWEETFVSHLASWMSRADAHISLVPGSGVFSSEWWRTGDLTKAQSAAVTQKKRKAGHMESCWPEDGSRGFAGDISRRIPRRKLFLSCQRA